MYFKNHLTYQDIVFQCSLLNDKRICTTNAGRDFRIFLFDFRNIKCPIVFLNGKHINHIVNVGGGIIAYASYKNKIKNKKRNNLKLELEHLWAQMVRCPFICNYKPGIFFEGYTGTAVS